MKYSILDVIKRLVSDKTSICISEHELSQVMKYLIDISDDTKTLNDIKVYLDSAIKFEQDIIGKNA